LGFGKFLRAFGERSESVSFFCSGSRQRLVDFFIVAFRSGEVCTVIAAFAERKATFLPTAPLLSTRPQDFRGFEKTEKKNEGLDGFRCGGMNVYEK
jgi:hypothetical protein